MAHDPDRPGSGNGEPSETRLRLRVLGSAAGGGYPQWNCLCPVCRLYWAGDSRVSARTQSSIAVSADGETWLLINASPDLRQQILDSSVLVPDTSGSNTRGSPIGAVLVTNGDVDHVAGLLTLRERQAFTLFGTRGVLDIVRGSPVFGVLNEDSVTIAPVASETPFEPVPGLTVSLFAVPGKVPLYMETETVDVGEEGDMTVGVELRAADRRIVYIPGCAHVPGRLVERVRGADVVLFDGTVFHDDEMAAAGVGEKTGRRMGHMPIAGDGGSLHAFDDANAGRRVYIHINNTNPILIEGSPERETVEAAGWAVAKDGMEIVP